MKPKNYRKVKKMNKEQDTRVQILNSLLDSTHRDVARVVNTHKDMLEKDPLFYGHLGCWAMENTDIRDHKEVFVASLLLSEYSEHREAGYVLLQKFPPHQVVRIKNHVKNVFKKNPPRIMKSAVKTYLKGFELDEARFDGAASSRQKKALVGLYSSFRIKPGANQEEDTTVVLDGDECKVTRAQAILFEDQPPVGSRPYYTKMLSKVEDPVEQAKMIVEHRIPYTTAVGAISNMTPTVLAALINNMSDQEILVNLGSLKRRGALNNKDIKALVDKKLKKVKKSKKVDVLKAVKTAEKSGVDADMAKQLVNISDHQLKQKGRISRSTALIVDKSSSMRVAIEISKGIGAMISTIVEGDFYCITADTASYEIKCKSSSLDDWQKAMRMVKANNATSCGVGIRHLINNNYFVEQIIMVTDQGENRHPLFLDELQRYKTKFGVMPRVIFVNCGRWSCHKLEDQCNSAGIECEAINIPDGADYYSIPNLIPLLTVPGRLELVEQIMQVPLPTRAEFDQKK